MIVAVVVAVVVPARVAGAQTAVAAAWVVVDADAGRVIESVNGRTPLPPASLTKVITALTVVRALPPSATVPVSGRAAAMPPSKVGMKAGQQWRLDDAMHALLLSSANDAAMALAERVSGSAEAFSAAQRATAAQLGMRDSPVLHDPAGLDGPHGLGGGNLVSAEDLAIAARAALAEPRIAPLLSTREYRFTAPDGRPRRLVNHNRLLWSYPGANGVKTGYTRRAGHCLSAAARRDGRAVLAVVLQAQDVYPTTAALLDAGFAAPPPAPAAGQASGRRSAALPLPAPLPAPPSVPLPTLPPLLPGAMAGLPSGGRLSAATAVLALGGVATGSGRALRRRHRPAPASSGAHQ
ncbi:MAG: hypothetical protein M3N68_06715 [Actinomycetota bacterium]|nr:hypothetical protein [Actinomycetota bacterium]